MDGISGGNNIANMWASKLSNLLNTHSPTSRDSLYSSLKSSLSDSQLSSIYVTDDDVLDAISQIKMHKSDSCSLSSEHLKSPASAISDSLAVFFTTILRHGYMPKAFRDCILVPIPNGSKDASYSKNYRAIALASSLSKVLERVLLLQYQSYCSSSLQFGFKSGYSATLCTGMIKNIVSRYIHNGSVVYGCFLDASQAFDLVDHHNYSLQERGLPAHILCFLLGWYRSQQMRVHWNSCMSDSFSVSNGVRQGSVLSPVLFAVYLDGLLSGSGVGCYWGAHFVGAVCYADDIALLAPYPSAMRTMLSVCEEYAVTHGLKFNPNKTQLIILCVRSQSTLSIMNHDRISLDGVDLKFSDTVMHLGHLLSYNLDDTPDIIRVTKDLNRKENFVLFTFKSADPFVKCFLIKAYCCPCMIVHCGLCLVNRCSSCAINNVFRKVWNLYTL